MLNLHESEGIEESPMLIGLTGSEISLYSSIATDYLQANHAEIALPGGQNIFWIDPDDLRLSPQRLWALCCFCKDRLKLIAAILVVDENAESRLFKGALTLPEYRGRGHMRRLVRWVRCLEGGTRQRAIVRVMPDGQPNQASLSAFQRAGFRICGELRHTLRFDATDQHLRQSAEEGDDCNYIRALELRAASLMKQQSPHSPEQAMSA